MRLIVITRTGFEKLLAADAAPVEATGGTRFIRIEVAKRE
jgi:hypothetical protein